MRRLTLSLLFVISINLSAQMVQFPLLEPISNFIPESFIVEGGANELITFWIDSTDLHMSKSLDDGATWGTPTMLVDNTVISDSLSDLNALKLNSGRILVTYKYKFHYVIYSDDNGSTWSEPAQLITDIGSIRPRKVLESSLSQTSDNKIWFVYNRLATIYNIQSDDGITWSEKEIMSVIGNGEPHFSSVNSQWNDSLVLIFQKNSDDTFDLYEMTSVDSGKNWSDETRVFDIGISKKRPRVTRDSNKNLWLTFTQAELTPFDEYTQTNIYYSKLPNGGNSWETPSKFTEHVGFNGMQNISIADGKQYISFTSDRNKDLTSWFGIVGETEDSGVPPAILKTNIKYQNNYPKVNLNITAKVFSVEAIDSVIFNYQNSGDALQYLQLFDDGLHNDSEAGDFIFGNDLFGLNYDFNINLFYSAVDIEGNKNITESENIQSPFLTDGGEYFTFDNNNILFPICLDGALADVSSVVYGRSGGELDDIPFIYAGGFALSGYTNGTLWGNGMMTAARVVDYIAGTIDSVDAISQIYVVRSSQPDFFQSWTDWKDAVKLGADFYDGDGDGVYNPVDLNNNGTWDTHEDKPDILGDITTFAVFNDGLESLSRLFNEVEPQGIEIKQTVFSYDKATSPNLSNVIFVRYKIENMGTVADKLDSVYFASWADMDIGNPYTNLIGTDTVLHSTYTYNEGEDDDFGINPPACFLTMLQGPPIFIDGKTYIDTDGNGIYDDGIDTPLDSAVNRKGELLGFVQYPGAKNNILTASTATMKSHSTQGAPDNETQLNNYMLGFNALGDILDPCTWEFGEVFNENCSSINPRFIYSGNPVAKDGWVNKYANDTRQLSPTGPFDLVKGEPIEIIVAYIVGRGTDALNSITEARRITNDVIGFYNTNFSYVPVGVKENISNQPTEFSLSQNYPNPFNPSTTIKYSIPVVGSLRATSVQLKIYDILGREVATLVNKQQSAGSYEVQFDASNLTSGVYFYRLRSGGNFNESKKMLLLK